MMTAFGSIVGIRSKVILHKVMHVISYRAVGTESNLS